MLLYKYYSVNLIVLFLLILQLQKCCCRDEGVLVHNPPAHGLNSKQSLTEHKHQKTVHEIFLECAVKERIIPGQEESVLQTVHSYAKLKGIDKAVFFGLSNDVFIGSKSLINKCAEDKDANIKIVAKHIVRTRCQISVEKGVTEFKINDDFILNLKKSEYGKCVRSHLVDHKSAHHFEHYVCKKKDCGEVKMVLVERYGKDNGIKNIFYSKMDYSFECLKKHECGIKHELKEGRVEFL
uniref:Uncharacterized protein n=1 Tax=Meloidogyne hapla TaxID=6305 RepID=A0A1I8BP86_MELHA